MQKEHLDEILDVIANEVRPILLEDKVYTMVDFERTVYDHLEKYELVPKNWEFDDKEIFKGEELVREVVNRLDITMQKGLLEWYYVGPNQTLQGKALEDVNYRKNLFVKAKQYLFELDFKEKSLPDLKSKVQEFFRQHVASTPRFKVDLIAPTAIDLSIDFCKEFIEDEIRYNKAN